MVTSGGNFPPSLSSSARGTSPFPPPQFYAYDHNLMNTNYISLFLWFVTSSDSTCRLLPPPPPATVADEVYSRGSRLRELTNLGSSWRGSIEDETGRELCLRSNWRGTWSLGSIVDRWSMWRGSMWRGSIKRGSMCRWFLDLSSISSTIE